MPKSTSKSSRAPVVTSISMGVTVTILQDEKETKHTITGTYPSPSFTTPAKLIAFIEKAAKGNVNGHR